MMEQPAYNDVTSSADLAATAELAYLDRSGKPRIRSITPVVSEGEPAFTLTYAESEAAKEIEASPEVVLIFSDSRLAYAGWNALCVTARRTELVEDPRGDDFLELFLDQELRKYPPSRQYMDTLMLRRENWWYTPRLMFHLRDLGEPLPIARRNAPDLGVLAWNSGEGLRVETAQVKDWEEERIALRSPTGDTTLAVSDARAALFFHDFSVPDMEQETSLLLTGWLSGGRLSVEGREGSRELPKLLGLISRFKAQRRLKKRCEAGLKARGAM